MLSRFMVWLAFRVDDFSRWCWRVSGRKSEDYPSDWGIPPEARKNYRRGTI